jgi:hypothetical protein
VFEASGATPQILEATMTRCTGLIGIVTVGVLSLSPVAAGGAQLGVMQLPCGTRTEMLDILTQNYGEKEVAHGLANTGALAEVFVGPSGTWTIVATSPNGKSCLIGAGQAWERTTTKANAKVYDEGI